DLHGGAQRAAVLGSGQQYGFSDVAAFDGVYGMGEAAHDKVHIPDDGMAVAGRQQGEIGEGDGLYLRFVADMAHHQRDHVALQVHDQVRVDAGAVFEQEVLQLEVPVDGYEVAAPQAIHRGVQRFYEPDNF